MLRYVTFSIKKWPILVIWGALLLIGVEKGFAQLEIIPNESLVCVNQSVSYNFQRLASSGEVADGVLWEWDLNGGFEPISQTLGGVDDNANTLTIPSADLSYDDVQIRLWYYYTDTTGGNNTPDSASALARLRVSSPPSNITQIFFPAGDEACPGDSIEMRARFQALGSYDSIAWYKGSISAGNLLQKSLDSIYFASQGGTYLVRLEGCSEGSAAQDGVTFGNTDPISSIDLLNPDADKICAGTSVSLQAIGGNTGPDEYIQWYEGSVASSNEIGTGNTISYTVTANVTILAQRIGCPNPVTKSIPLEIRPGPETPQAPVADLDTACIGDEVTLNSVGDVGADATYEWYLDPGSTSNPVATGDTYQATLSNAGTNTFYLRRRDNICLVISELSQVEVVANSGATVTISGDEELCIGVEGVFLASSDDPTDAFSWDFGPDATPTSAEGIGPHSVLFSTVGQQSVSVVQEIPGCPAGDSHPILVSDAPVLTIDSLAEFPLVYEVAEGIDLELGFGSVVPGASISWTWEGDPGKLAGGSSGSGSGSFFSESWTLAPDAPQASIVVEVSLNSNGCDSIFSFEVLVSRRLFIPDLLTPNGDGFNDTWEILFVEGGELLAEDYEVKVMNRQGICVCGCDDSFTLANAVNWDGAGLPAGAYWYVIEASDGFKKTGPITLLY